MFILHLILKENIYYFTIDSSKSQLALTSITSIVIKTNTMIETWIYFTLINICFTIYSFIPKCQQINIKSMNYKDIFNTNLPSFTTSTSIIIHTVNTYTSVLTRT